MATDNWTFGDRVVHVQRPEWGAGVVTTAQTTTQDGKPCQMVTVRFERAGIKTLSTAFAHLRKAAAGENPGGNGTLNGDGHEGPDPFLEKMRGTPDPKQQMLKIEDAATDPFATPLQRFQATARLYRYQPSGRSLLDWAAVQSGLADPMSVHNRHELERFFEQWSIGRDQHLKKVAQELKKADPGALAQAIREAPPSVQQTLRRLDALR